MKIVVALAVVTFCAVLQIVSVGGSLADHLATLNEQIDVVQKVVAGVRKVQYDDLLPEVLDFATLGRGNISDIISRRCEPTVEYMEEMFDNSTAAGKDPTACAASAMTVFGPLLNATARNLEACFDLATDWAHETADGLEANIREGMNVLLNLNQIFPTCYTNNTEEIGSCVAGILPNATAIVESYKTTTIAAMEEIKEHESPVQDEIATCMFAALDDLDEARDTMKSNAEKCVAAL